MLCTGTLIPTLTRRLIYSGCYDKHGKYIRYNSIVDTSGVMMERSNMAAPMLIPSVEMGRRKVASLLTGLAVKGFRIARAYSNHPEIGSLRREDTNASTVIDEIWYRDVERPSDGCRIPNIDSCLSDLKPRIVRRNDVAHVSDWKDAASNGPLLLLPVFSPENDADTKRQIADGLLVLFSTPESQRNLSEIPSLTEFRGQLASALNHIRNSAQHHWYHTAMKVLPLTTARLLQIDMDSLIPPPRAGDPPSTSHDAIEPSRVHVAERITDIIKETFALSRCALLLPSKDYPESWTLVGRQGFPDNPLYDACLYSRGDGLSGTVLLCKPGATVCSSDFPQDSRWSRKFGETYTRHQNECGPMGYLGVPIFSRFRQKDTLPYAALICIRSRYGNPNVGAFMPEEKLHLQTIATHIAYALDTLQWREQTNARAERHLTMSRIWASRRRETEMYAAALRLLKKELPFRRLLLSVVDPNRAQIVGRATVGFDEDLVVDTVRPIFSNAPDSASDEDILGRICRERVLAPFVVDPNDPNDAWALNVNVHAKVKHRVTNKLLLIPMTRYGGDVVGVVLAEFSDRMPQTIAPEDLTRFSLYANQLAGMIELHHLESEAHREQTVFLELMRSFEHREGERWSSDRTLRTLLASVCREYDLQKGLIYKYDEVNHVLEGAVGHAVNGGAVRETIYSLEPDDVVARPTMSLARAVYLKREPIFLSSMGKDTVVDQRDRDKVGIAEDSAGLGVPLIYDGRVHGVLIVCSNSCCAPTKECIAHITTFGQIGALAIAVETTSRILEDSHRAAAAQEAIIRQIGMIASSVGATAPSNLKSIAMEDHSKLQVIVEDAAKLFGAPLCGLFLADEVVAMPIIAGSTEFDPRKYTADRHFWIRAGRGYECDVQNAIEDAAFSYNAQEKGLTAQVLATLEPASSDNVEKDDRWSAKLETKIVKSLRGKLRTWMGVPLVLRDNKKQHFFGALTFTRERKFVKDTLAFSDREIAIAENVAWLISLALYNKQRMNRVVYSFEQIIGLLRHGGISGPLVDVRDVYARSIGHIVTGKRITDASRRKLLAGCRAIENTMDFVLCGYSAYDDYVRKGKDPSVGPVWDDVENVSVGREILDVVLPACRVMANNVGVEIEERVVPSRGMSFYIDKTKVRFILLSLIQNGIRACQRKGNDDGKVTVTVEGTTAGLSLCVADNGCGIPKELCEQAIFEEGYSGFQSTGLGLAIVRAFVDSAKFNGQKGCLHCESEIGVGSTFHVWIPVRVD